MYAVIKTGGKQYRVAPGDTLRIEQIGSGIGDVVTIDQVLAVSNGDSSLIGEPLVNGASVSATIVDQGKGEKIRVFKMRRRKHYRKTLGHRQLFTEIFVSKIESSLGAESADAGDALAQAKARRERIAAATLPGTVHDARGLRKGGKRRTADDSESTPRVSEAPVQEPEQAPAPTPTVAPTMADDKSDAKPDDLTKVEGIGPKIAELLQADGITTFAQLAETDVEKISKILADAGARFATHDPTTWPEQAGLAASGQWDALEKLQDELDGGRRV